ncbi:hypothetical protein EVAR_18392_1 [Eumeta japonica]|uniref:Uncharacterized protein n=1 Tax=Eumeta variegata TaxID=151549 RepID=A0A4C1UVA1_EUMVA|nr:hypothetical protein EVAR_18392_1 [Eumeta japonica]
MKPAFQTISAAVLCGAYECSACIDISTAVLSYESRMAATRAERLILQISGIFKDNSISAVYGTVLSESKRTCPAHIRVRPQRDSGAPAQPLMRLCERGLTTKNYELIVTFIEDLGQGSMCGIVTRSRPAFTTNQQLQCLGRSEFYTYKFNSTRPVRSEKLKPHQARKILGLESVAQWSKVTPQNINVPSSILVTGGLNDESSRISTQVNVSHIIDSRATNGRARAHDGPSRARGLSVDAQTDNGCPRNLRGAKRPTYLSRAGRASRTLRKSYFIPKKIFLRKPRGSSEVGGVGDELYAAKLRRFCFVFCRHFFYEPRLGRRPPRNANKSVKMRGAGKNRQKYCAVRGDHKARRARLPAPRRGPSARAGR